MAYRPTHDIHVLPIHPTPHCLLLAAAVGPLELGRDEGVGQVSRLSRGQVGSHGHQAAHPGVASTNTHEAEAAAGLGDPRGAAAAEARVGQHADALTAAPGPPAAAALVEEDGARLEAADVPNFVGKKLGVATQATRRVTQPLTIVYAAVKVLGGDVVVSGT